MWFAAIIAVVHERNPQSYAFQRKALRPGSSQRKGMANRRCEMRSQDLMRPDLLSEIVLLAFGALMLSTLLLFVITAWTRLTAQPI
jgi:hypothetical protein